LTLPPERKGHIASADLAERRIGLAAAVAAGVWRTDPAAEEVQIGGVRCLRFSPSGASRGTLLHMHGGAFRIGCPEQIAPFALALAQACKVIVICPAYRLAPEHPFPAGLNDGWAVLRALAETEGHALILSGDSAGGGLAASLAALAHHAGISPAGLALLSPWLDLSVIDPAYTTNAATDPLFSAQAAREAAALYLQGHMPGDSLASPLLVELSGYPPTYLNVGTGEVLAGDAGRLRDRLEQAGVPVTLHVVDGMEHVAVTRDRSLVGSDETFERLAEFVESILLPAD
jgi:monoterpene epsilon-lactone hydrolase